MIQIIKNFEKDRGENHSNPARSQVQGLMIGHVDPQMEISHAIEQSKVPKSTHAQPTAHAP